MNRYLQLASVFLVTVFCVSAEAHEEFIFFGTGTTTQFSEQGVVGESVDISFQYRVSDFPSTSGNPDTSSWSPATAIPIQAIGSISGDNFQLAPLGRIAMTAFSKIQVQFDSTYENLTLQSIGLLQASRSDTALRPPIPVDFEIAHGIFYNELLNGDIWTPITRSNILGVNNSGRLRLENFSWTIVAIPEPKQSYALLSCVTLLTSRRRRNARASRFQ